MLSKGNRKTFFSSQSKLNLLWKLCVYAWLTQETSGLKWFLSGIFLLLFYLSSVVTYIEKFSMYVDGFSPYIHL